MSKITLELSDDRQFVIAVVATEKPTAIHHDNDQNSSEQQATEAQQHKSRFSRIMPAGQPTKVLDHEAYRGKKFIRRTSNNEPDAKTNTIGQPQNIIESTAKPLVQPNTGSIGTVTPPNTIEKTAQDQTQIDQKWVQQALNCEEFANYSVLEDGVQQLLKIVNEPHADAPTTSHVNIAECRHALANITISDDALAATLTIITGSAGTLISDADIDQALDDAGIKFGVNRQKIAALIDLGKTQKPGTSINDIIAFGKPPENGNDTQFLALIKLKSDAIAHDDDDKIKINWLDHGEIPTVHQSDRLLQRIAATRGQDGCSVKGDTIESTPGHDIAFELADGVQISTEDPNILVATITGQPIAIPNGMMVEQILHLKNVDIHSGNILFDGSVMIAGSVKEGLTVEATGDIVVGDMVESATLKAGRNIAVSNGIIGHTDSHQATKHKIFDYSSLTTTICANGAIDVSFAQFAELKADKDICVEKMLLHCSATTNGSIIVGGASATDGKLIGGEIRAVERIEAKEIGSEAFIKTLLHFPCNTPALQEKDKQLSTEINNHEHTRQELVQLKARYSLSTKSPEITATIERINGTITQLEGTISRLESETSEIKTAKTQLKKNSQVIIHKAAYPGIKTTIADKTYVTRHHYGSGTIRWHNGSVGFNATVKT